MPAMASGNLPGLDGLCEHRRAGPDWPQQRLFASSFIVLETAINHGGFLQPEAGRALANGQQVRHLRR